MYMAIIKKFLIRAVRNDTKQPKMKCPMTNPDIGLLGMEKGRSMYARRHGKPSERRGPLSQALNNE